MTVRWRKLAPNETDHEGIFAAVLAFFVLIGAGWLLLGLPALECQVFKFTGVPCLSCGGTRAVRELLHGDLLAAMRWNPLVAASAMGAAVFGCYAAAVSIGRLPRLRISAGSAREVFLVRMAAVVILAANWIYLLATVSRRG